MDVFFAILPLTIVAVFFILLIKYFLNPLFFPETFPEKEVINFMNKKGLIFNSYKKVNKESSSFFRKNIKINKSNSINSIMISPFLYRKSYFMIIYNNDKVLWLRFFKSSSYFDKNKLVFYLENEIIVI